MIRSHILGLLLLLIWSSTGQAFNKTGSFLEVNSGSMMGLGHVSYGIEFSQRHNWSIGLGYVPELSYHDEMTIFSARYRYQRGSIYEFDLFKYHVRMRPGSFGLTFISGRDDDIYRELPNRYPEGYYYSTARRMIFNYQWNFLIEDNVEVYLDLSALEVGVVNWVRNNEFYRDNYRFFGLDGIFTYGFGTRWRF
jgi:hypothetical protein